MCYMCMFVTNWVPRIITIYFSSIFPMWLGATHICLYLNRTLPKDLQVAACMYAYSIFWLARAHKRLGDGWSFYGT